MALDTTKILMLGGLAVAGFFVYRKFSGAAAAGQMARELEDVTPADAAEAYQAAEKTWQQRLQPETLANGDLLFHPLDLSQGNPLAGFEVVVKHMGRSLNQLAGESGRSAIYLSSDRPNDAWPIARVYFFNPKTGREVAAFELKKNADLWLPDMPKALEATFVHAFNYACKQQPRYNQWDNTLNTATKEAGIPYLKDQCNVRYPVNL